MSATAPEHDVLDLPAMSRTVRSIASSGSRCSFKEAMAHLAAPVTVVTAALDGVPSGTTVSAAMSVSMTPELLAVGLARNSGSLAVITGTRRFAMNALAVDQVDLAMRFASKANDKFEGIGWQLESGLPRIDGASVWVRCRVHRLVDAGDHILVIGLVESADRISGHEPLTYHARSFGTHGVLA